MTDDTPNVPECAARRVTHGPAHHFFGGGERDPWSPSGKYLLAMKADFNDRLPGKDDAAGVGVVALEGNHAWQPAGETTAWNWQQGAMAQWIPGQDDLIIFNAIRDGTAVSVITDVNGYGERILPCPVYCLTRTGTRAFSTNFARVQFHRRGCGYAGLPPPAPSEPVPADDGIWLLDLTTGDKRLVLSCIDLLEWTGMDEKEVEGTYIDHLQISKEGTRLGFLHHAVLKGARTHTHLITSSMTGSQLYCVTKGLAFDFSWGPGGKIVAWCGPKTGAASVRSGAGWLLRQARRAFRLLGEPDWFREQVLQAIHTTILGCRYRIFHDEEGETDVIDGELLSEGHPVFSPNAQWVVTDTRPDAHHMRTLRLLNLQGRWSAVLGSFYSPPSLKGEIRCDFHPRPRGDMKAVCFDSCHEGSRQIYLMDVPPSAMATSRPPVQPIESVLAD